MRARALGARVGEDTVTPRLMLVALYRLPDTEARVCLGVRIGGPDDVIRLRALLVKQVRQRFPEYFAGMRLPQVMKVLAIDVYDTEPDKHGFPKWLGEAGWWA